MSLSTSSIFAFIVISFLVSTSSAQLKSGKPGKIRPGKSGKPGKIRPGIVPDERKGTFTTLSKNEEIPQIEITSIKGKSIRVLLDNLFL